MSTSGSINFKLARTEIIDHAFRLLSVYGEQETVSGEDTAIANRALNLMIKSWQASGIHLWLDTEATLIMEAGIPQYTISSTSGRCSDIMVETDLSGDEAAGQTTLSVTNTDNIEISDIIGVVLDDGTIQWNTVTAKSATTVTVLTALTGAATSGNRVYAFTTRTSRPNTISSVRVRDDSDTDRALKRISRKEYFDIVNKYVTGQPISWYYDPQLTGGVIRVWPAPESSNYRLKLTYQRSLEDMDSATDNPDFPVEWTETLVYNLAMRLAPIFDKEDKLAVIAPMASDLLENLKDYDNEQTSMFIQPQIRDY